MSMRKRKHNIFSSGREPERETLKERKRERDSRKRKRRLDEMFRIINRFSRINPLIIVDLIFVTSALLHQATGFSEEIRQWRNPPIQQTEAPEAAKA
ncbi:hypothetical protein [Microvirga sp. BSC39]|uniref:hypothetical protein n=1 Tax=Microvirga sp. BSC39 TaxID=1549810 RepID=UPI00126A6BF7|nr:hypothetical protein [Microvirga sp. BSC39]